MKKLKKQLTWKELFRQYKWYFMLIVTRTLDKIKNMFR